MTEAPSSFLKRLQQQAEGESTIVSEPLEMGLVWMTQFGFTASTILLAAFWISADESEKGNFVTTMLTCAIAAGAYYAKGTGYGTGDRSAGKSAWDPEKRKAPRWHIRQVAFYASAIGDDGCTTLASVIRTNKLRSVELINVAARAPGMQVFSNILKANGSLRTLVVDHNPLGCAGAAARGQRRHKAVSWLGTSPSNILK